MTTPPPQPPSSQPPIPSTIHPDPFIIHPTATHTSTIIFLHGTSQTGASFASSILSIPFSLPSSAQTPAATLPAHLPHSKLIFPTGSPKPLTVFGNALSHAWFDIHTFSDRTVGEAESVAGMRESVGYISGLVEGEVGVLDAVRKGRGGDGDGDGKREGDSKGREEGKGRGGVTVIGFSQGCALGMMCLLSGTTLTRNGVSAFIGVSGWCPFRAQIEDGVEGEKKEVGEFVRGLLGLGDLLDLDELGSGEGEEEREEVKVLLMHGESDEKMKLHWGEEMRVLIERLGWDVKWKSYRGLGHAWCEEEMGDVVAFLSGVCGEEVV